MPGRYALIVANGTYRDEKLSRLRTPTRDADELARVLHDPKIGDFAVELAVDEPEAVLRRKIATFFADRGRDDLLLLHFSCHGLKDDSGQLYFAAPDTEVAHLDATALSAEFVSRQMTRSRSRKVVALLDCCYSGAIARGLRFRGGDQVDLDDHLGGHGRVILTASSAMEYAFEGEELTGDGNPSVFTTAVVKGLETGEADRDQDHRISVEELYDYVCEQVREITPDQSPNMLSHLEGELYVARSSYVAPLPPAELPAELRAAMDSALAGVREGAVTELARLLDAHDASLAQAAGQALRRLTDDDSRRVAAAAELVLERAPEVVGTVPEAPLHVGAPAPPRPEPRPSESRDRDRFTPVLSTLGALMILASLTALANDPFVQSQLRVEILALTATIAAAAIPLLRLAGLVAPESLPSGVAAVTLAGVPLGLAAGAGGLADEFGTPFPAALTAVGALLLLLAGALARFRGPAPLREASRLSAAVLLVAGVALAVSFSAPWYNGGSGSYQLLWPAEYALWAAVAVTVTSAGLGLGRRRSPRLLAGAVPAAGATVIALVLSVSEWTAVNSDDGGYGLAVALIAGALVVLAGGARLLRESS